MSNRSSPFDNVVDSFKPKAGQGKKRPTAEDIDRTSTFPSRDPAPQTEQSGAMTAIGIRYHPHVIERFKQMCADDRRSYGAMLEILMDAFEDPRGA